MTAAALPPVVDAGTWQGQGWPQSPTYSRWASSQDVAAHYGPDA